MTGRLERGYIEAAFSNNFTFSCPSDLAQDAAITVVQNFGRFHGDTEEELFSRLTAIVHTATRNATRHVLAVKRDCRRNTSLEGRARIATNVVDRTNTPLDAAIRAEDARVIAKALGRLSGEDQWVIKMWLRCNRVGRVAEMLGIKCAAAYKRIARALDRLAGEATGLGAGGDP
jgi:RNA polymerase sigma factor (sigma-70 family)